MDIKIEKSDIIAEVKRSLSIIASRSVNEKGEKLFEQITLSSNEEPILTDFFNASFVSLATKVRDFISIFRDGDSVSLSFSMDGNYNDVLPFVTTCRYYVISDILARWLTITSPKLAEKYESDADHYLNDLLIQFYNRKKPAVSVDPLKKLTT